MTVLTLLPCLPLLAAATSNNRMVVTHTQYCVDVFDENGDKHPCGVSWLEGTRGAPLPGTKAGARMTWQEDVISVREGTVTVGNSPLRPYVLSMTVENATHTTEMQLYNGKASLVGEARSASPLPSRDYEASLEEEGFVLRGREIVDSQVCDRYQKHSGIEEDDDGVSYGHLFASGVVPDTWTLYVDAETGRWVKMDATNSYNQDVLYQSSSFSDHTPLPDDMDLETAVANALLAYHSAPVAASALGPDDHPLSDKMGRMRDESGGSRRFYAQERHVDWMPDNRVRGSNSFKGIRYFTMEEVSATEPYFKDFKVNTALAKSNDYFTLNVPKGCSTISDTCSQLLLSYPPEAYVQFEFGMYFNDVDRAAMLRVLVTLTKNATLVTQLDATAAGCSTIAEYGATQIKLSVTLCLTADVRHAAVQTINVTATLRLAARLWKVGVTPTGNGNVSVTVYNSTRLGLYGYLLVEAKKTTVGAGAGVYMDHHSINGVLLTWMLAAGSRFHAYVDAKAYKNKWALSFPMYQEGPVNLTGTP